MFLVFVCVSCVCLFVSFVFVFLVFVCVSCVCLCFLYLFTFVVLFGSAGFVYVDNF